MMKLYYAPGTCALARWIALEWANANYEAVRADYTSAEYQRINPLAAVPALDIGGTRAISQAFAILQYIADTHPDANLGNDGTPEGALLLNETLSFLASDFHPAFWPFFFPQRYSTDHSEAALQSVKEASYARIDRAMQHIENRLLADGDYLYQNRKTIADAYAFVMIRWTQALSKTWHEYPRIAAFMARMQDDPAVKKVLTAQKG